jgi:hypothetical protein
MSEASARTDSSAQALSRHTRSVTFCQISHVLSGTCTVSIKASMHDSFSLTLLCKSVSAA